MGICVCVCVWVGEREAGKGFKEGSFPIFPPLFAPLPIFFSASNLFCNIKSKVVGLDRGMPQLPHTCHT